LPKKPALQTPAGLGRHIQIESNSSAAAFLKNRPLLKNLARLRVATARRGPSVVWKERTQAQHFAVTGAEASIAQSEKRIAQITSNYHQQLQTERIQTQALLEKLQQDWEKQSHKNALLELKAPQSGIVKDIANLGNVSRHIL
jgi:multidrug resistance efflux pump